MKKILIRIWILIAIIYSSNAVVVAQAEEEVLANDDVIEMVKAGLSDSVIIAKIKSSKTSFETSSEYLVRLKENGVSDLLVTTMLEASSAKTPSNDSSYTIGAPQDLKSIIGKQKVFIESVDEKSQVEINKIIQKAGFLVVSKKTDAELIFQLTFSTSELNFGYSPGLFGGMGMGSTSTLKQGKLAVYLIGQDNILHLAWVKEFTRTFPGKLLEKQAKDFSEDFVKALRKLQQNK